MSKLVKLLLKNGSAHDMNISHDHMITCHTVINQLENVKNYLHHYQA